MPAPASLLWDDAHPVYRAGWLAYWKARELLAEVLALGTTD